MPRNLITNCCIYDQLMVHKMLFHNQIIKLGFYFVYFIGDEIRGLNPNPCDKLILGVSVCDSDRHV